MADNKDKHNWVLKPGGGRVRGTTMRRRCRAGEEEEEDALGTGGG